MRNTRWATRAIFPARNDDRLNSSMVVEMVEHYQTGNIHIFKRT